MPKQVAVDRQTYDTLVSLSGDLTKLMKKQVTLGMTVSCSVSLLGVILRNPLLFRLFSETLDQSQPSIDFEPVWDVVASKVVGREESR